MMDIWSFLVVGLFMVIFFCVGVVIGVYDCKRSYGIPKGVTPDEFNEYLDTLVELQRGYEVQHGNECP